MNNKIDSLFVELIQDNKFLSIKSELETLSEFTEDLREMCEENFILL